MKKLTLGLPVAAALAALLAAGGAYAVENGRAGPGAMPKVDVTRAEAQTKAAEMFAKLDANKDGKLDQTDREAHRTEMRGKFFDKLDTDGNGAISRDEFSAHHREGGDREHRKGGHKGMRGHHGGHAGMMMRMADTNQDGAVSQSEFTAHAMQMFDRADTDNNGTVTIAEREAARQAMRQHMKDMRKDRMGGPDTPPPAAN